jgi:hypothetical protein
MLKGECSIIGYTLMKVQLDVYGMTLEGDIGEVLTALKSLEKCNDLNLGEGISLGIMRQIKILSAMKL